MAYGMPYRGSKSKIAYKLMQALPAGKRFVDLFGGGGAMAHAAALSGKYNSVLYNEIQPRVVDCFQKSLNGYFDTFIPEWVSKEYFYKHRMDDGYIAICWSYGGNMRSYEYGPANEEAARLLHNFIVYGERNEALKDILPEEVIKNVDGRTMRERRLKTGVRVEHLQRLERLISLSGLHIDITNGSYEEYVHHPGDVVYCDIPYEISEGYKQKFDKQAFVDWALSRPYPVYISEYDSPFECVWQTEKTCTFSPVNNNKKTVERLFINRRRAAA